jgi:NTP pyrophosphatase (non-canonical NTP hydrolase)
MEKNMNTEVHEDSWLDLMEESGELEHVFGDLGETTLDINQANGWNVTTPASWDEQYKIPAVIALIGSEASEALEAFRKGDRENFVEEMADVIIRVVDCTAGLKMDLGKAVLAKLRKNMTRGYRHGGKRV